MRLEEQALTLGILSKGTEKKYNIGNGDILSADRIRTTHETRKIKQSHN
jgi:hypothetical protein